MLLDVRRLHRHMSSPAWSPVQWTAAADVLAGTEQDLADALYGAVFEPFEHAENAAVDRDGLVHTSWPVFALIAVDGVTATDDTHVTGYQVVRHRLRRAPAAALGAGLGHTTAGSLSDFLPRSGLGAAPEPSPPFAGVAAVHYMAGWGPEPALVRAILDKAATRFGDRHADTMVVTGVNAQSAGPREAKEWTDPELANLARYRHLGWAGTT